MSEATAVIALGANLPSPLGPPAAALEAAIAELGCDGDRIVARSGHYLTRPVPEPDPPGSQPDFVNAVALLATGRTAPDLLTRLHEVEARIGRARRRIWEARVIDLDLIALGDAVIPADWPGDTRQPQPGAPATARPIVVPHPRMHRRAFVLAPLCEIAPDWRHPVFGRTAADLLREFRADPPAEP